MCPHCDARESPLLPFFPLLGGVRVLGPFVLVSSHFNHSPVSSWFPMGPIRRPSWLRLPLHVALWRPCLACGSKKSHQDMERVFFFFWGGAFSRLKTSCLVLPQRALSGPAIAFPWLEP